MPGEVQLLLVGHRRLSIKELVSLGPPLEVEVDHWNTCVCFAVLCLVVGSSDALLVLRSRMCGPLRVAAQALPLRCKLAFAFIFFRSSPVLSLL